MPSLKFLMSSILGAAILMPAWAADTAANPSASAAEASIEQRMTQYRNELQAARADLVAKGLTLTAEEAAKFWPLYEQYQKEQNEIIDGQIKAVKQYADSYDKLSDADALAFVKATLERDGKMQALRVKWLDKFQTVVAGGAAARAIQIDRRLSLVGQLDLSSRIPLVH